MRQLMASTAVATILALGAAVHAQSVTLGAVDLSLQGRVYGFISASSGQNHVFGASEAVRLIPQISIVGSNGIKFGAIADVREGAATSPAPQVHDASVYTRRVYVYASSDSMGSFRLGTTDGASGLYQVGTFDVGVSQINDGGWNGIAHYGLASAVNPAWPFASSRFYYAANKLVYMSPRLGGMLDVAVSYEPNVHGLNVNQGGGYLSGTNSDYADAANLADAGQRRHNTIDGIAHFYHNYGNVGVVATASYVASGHDNDVSPVTGLHYQGLGFFDAGGTVSYAGFTVGANLQRGKFNGTWELSPRNAADSTAYTIGATYKIAAYSLGVSYFNYRSPGADALSMRQEDGIAAGASYSFSKNLSFYADYLNGHRHQDGYDFWTNTLGSTGNSVDTNMVTLGGKFAW